MDRDFLNWISSDLKDKAAVETSRVTKARLECVISVIESSAAFDAIIRRLRVLKIGIMPDVGEKIIDEILDKIDKHLKQ